MSHHIKYVFNVDDPKKRVILFEFLKQHFYGEALSNRLVSIDDYLKMFDLKIAEEDCFPVIKKGDISFLDSSKINMIPLYVEIVKKLPDVNWTCEEWDEWAGLCYIAQNIDGIAKGWNIITTPEEWDGYFNASLSECLRDDYFCPPVK